MVKNTYCGTCMECLRTCPHDNIAVNLRQPGLDLEVQSGRKFDEAYKAFIMLGSAVLYSAVLLGPWGDLKMAAYSVGSLAWAQYAVLFLVFVLAILPGFFYLAVWSGNQLAQQEKMTTKTFVSMTYALIPLGMGAWIAFSLSFVLANFSYVWIVASDPFGWGWDLFGKASTAWSPYLNSVTPVLQVIVLASGAAWSAVTARKIASEKLDHRPAMLQSTPVAGFCLVVSMILLVLLVG
jgi:hypothetical protein